MPEYILNLFIHLRQDCKQDKSVILEVHAIISRSLNQQMRVTELEESESLSCYLLSEARLITEELKKKYKRKLYNLESFDPENSTVEIITKVTMDNPVVTVTGLDL